MMAGKSIEMCPHDRPMAGRGETHLFTSTPSVCNNALRSGEDNHKLGVDDYDLEEDVTWFGSKGRYCNKNIQNKISAGRIGYLIKGYICGEIRFEKANLVVVDKADVCARSVYLIVTRYGEKKRAQIIKPLKL